METIELLSKRTFFYFVGILTIILMTSGLIISIQLIDIDKTFAPFPFLILANLGLFAFVITLLSQRKYWCVL